MLCRFWANWDLDSWAQFAKNRPDKVKDKNPWRHVVTPCENFDRNELLQFYFGISFYVCPHYSCFAFYLWATNIFLLLHFICEAQYSSSGVLSIQFRGDLSLSPNSHIWSNPCVWYLISEPWQAHVGDMIHQCCVCVCVCSGSTHTHTAAVMRIWSDQKCVL